MTSNPNDSAVSVRRSSGRPLRVLHVLRALHAGSGGPLTHLEHLYAELEGSCFEQRIATLEYCEPPHTVPPPVFRGSPGRDVLRLRKALALARWLQRELAAFDVVQIHGVFGWHALLTASLCKRAGVPYVVCPHGCLSPGFLSQGGGRMRAYLQIAGLHTLRASRALIAMTPMEADSFRALDPDLPVTRIYPGVDVPEPAAPGGAGDPLRIVFVGRIVPAKNLPDLFSACALLRSRQLAFHLDLIGSGAHEYTARMQALAEQCGIAGQTTFHGSVYGDDKWNLMRRGQVLALPSNFESFSYVTAESLALGLPAVVSDRVALAPLVSEFDCGRVVPLGNVPALADALQAFADRTYWTQASQAARRCAQQHLSLGSMRTSLRRLYLDAAARPES